MKRKAAKLSMLMSVMILLSFLMAAPACAETVKAVKKAPPTSTKSVANKKALNVKEGTHRLKVSQGGYVVFAAPKAGKYAFTFSGLSAGCGYASFMKADTSKTIAVMGDGKVSTKGGKSSTLWICTKSFASFYTGHPLRIRPVPTRTGTVSMKKGEKAYLYISTGGVVKVTLKVARKKG